MSDPIEELDSILGEAGLEVRFGLVRQGHIPTVERMREDGCSWAEVGKAIGWCPDTTRRFYEAYLRDKVMGLRELLRRCEWSQRDICNRTCCPFCGARKWPEAGHAGRRGPPGRHEPGCEFVAVVEGP